jgi:short subunit dehydrogenase-like uncharacterized protein
VPFVRASADRFHAQAQDTGARITHACGFDSVPSDLAALLTAQAAGGGLTDTTMVVTRLSGGISGGTIDSLRGVVDELTSDPATRRLLADPYSLSPDRDAEPSLGRESDATGVGRIDGRWTGVFVMASFNTRIVRRSNALQGWAYGRGFRYREVMSFGAGRSAGARRRHRPRGAGMGFGMALPPTRAVLDRVLPKPGEGPSERTASAGTSPSRRPARRRTAAASARPSPCRATRLRRHAVMLGESGLCLALDDLPGEGGVLTPATAMGTLLVDRLRGGRRAIETAALA